MREASHFAHRVIGTGETAMLGSLIRYATRGYDLFTFSRMDFHPSRLPLPPLYLDPNIEELFHDPDIG